MTVIFHPGVQTDLNEVLDYYAAHSDTAPDRFWEAFQGRLTEISANPLRFGFVRQDKGIRRVRLRKFPYSIL